MKKILPYVLAFFTALAAAALLCALRLRCPAPLTDVLSPVYGSPWELGKAAFFPLLCAAPLLWGVQRGGSRGGLCLMAVVGAGVSLGLACLLPPAAAVAAAIGAAVTLYALVLRHMGGDALPWYGLTIALAVAYILLTILPPSGGVFDPRTVAAAGIPF